MSDFFCIHGRFILATVNQGLVGSQSCQVLCGASKPIELITTFRSIGPATNRSRLPQCKISGYCKHWPLLGGCTGKCGPSENNKTRSFEVLKLGSTTTLKVNYELC